MKPRHRRGLAALFIPILVAALAAGCGDSNAPETGRPSTKAARAEKKPVRPRPKTARRKAAGSLIDRLPSGTVLVAHFPDIARTRAALAGTTLAEILAEEELQKFLAMPLDMALSSIRRLREDQGIDLEAIVRSLAGEAVLGVTLDGREPGVVGAIDLGDAYLGVHKLVRLVTKKWFQMVSRDGVDVFTMRRGGVASSETSFCFHEGRLFFAIGEGMLDRLLAGPTSPLSAHAVYQEAVSRSFGADADFRLWVNLEPLVRFAATSGGPEAGAVLEGLGLDRARSLVLATFIDGQEFRERAVFLGAGGNPLLERLFVNKPVNRETLGRVPGNVESCFVARLRLAWIPDFLASLAGRHGETAASAVVQGLMAAETSLGLPLESFLAALDDEMVYLQLKPADYVPIDERMKNPFRNSVLAWRLKDETRIVAALDHMAEYSRFLRREVVPGRDGDWWRLACDLPFEPFVTVRDGWVALAADHGALVEFLAGPSQRSVLESPLFEVRLRSMPEKVAALSYTDLRPSVEQFLELVQGLVPMIASAMDGPASVPFDLHRIPDSRVISQHLTPATGYVHLIEDGLVVENISPIGTATLALPAAAVGFSAAIAAAPFPGAAARGDGRQPRRAAGAPGWMKWFGSGRPPATPPAAAGPSGAKAAPEAPEPRPRHRGTDPQRNERNALHLLRSLVDAQAMFRKNRTVDEDGNGVGEFGTFGEMAGTAHLRHGDRPTDEPILAPAFGKIEKGALKKSGYYFKLYLPGAEGKPLAEHMEGGAPGGVDPSRAEKCWCALAWPVSSLSGARSFYVDQGGRIYQSIFPFRGDKAPDPNLMLNRPDDLTSGLKASGQATDGSRWTPVE